MKKLKMIDLFAGIGGIRMGFEKAFKKDLETVFSCEIDKNAAKTYKENFGDDPTGDVTKIKEKELADFDIVGAGFPCFPAGTLIKTSTGYKNIEDVEVNDLVLTHKNRYRRVKGTMEKEAPGLIELFFVSGSIKTTPEHPFLVSTRTTYYEKRKKKYKFSEPHWKNAIDLTSDDYICFNDHNLLENKTQPYIPEISFKINQFSTKNIPKVKITPELAWVFGRCMADGWRAVYKRKNRKNSFTHNVIICCNYNEVPELEKRLDAAKLVYSTSDERTVKRFIISNSQLFNYLESFGKDCYTKSIPEEILYAPLNILKSFWEGYVSGNGHIDTKKNCISVGTVSKLLAYQYQLICLRLFKKPSSVAKYGVEKIVTIENRQVKVQPLYHLRLFSKSQIPSKTHSDYIFSSIKKKRLFHEEKTNVYNIEVEEDNSYTANNVIVHNCQAFSVAGKRKGFEEARGTLFFDVARIIKEKKPSVVFLENVKGLTNHDKGNTLKVILNTLEELGYAYFYKVLNSKDYGVPQKRERIYIVAFNKEKVKGYEDFQFPKKSSKKVKVEDILQENVELKHFVSKRYLKSLKAHKKRHQSKGNGFGYEVIPEDGIANTLVTGGMGRERNLVVDHSVPTNNLKKKKSKNKENLRVMTVREWARLQGLPDSFKFPVADGPAYKQLGNSVAVNVIHAIAKEIRKILEKN